MSDALDTLCELLARFGGLLPAEQMARVQALALGYLGESKAALRKKAMHCLGEGGGCRPWPWGVGQCRHTISAVLKPILLSPPPPFPSRCVSAPAGPPAGRGRGSAAGPAVRPQGAAARRRGAHLRAGGGASEVGGRKGRYPAHKERLSSSCIISATLLTSPPPVSPLPPLQPCRGLPLWPLPRLYSPTGCGPLRTSRGGRRGAERALPAGVVNQ